MVFHPVVLFWIINNNNNIKFDINVKVGQWMCKGPWYNTTICTELDDQIFKYYLKTGRKEMYELMCAVDAYDKERVPMPDYSIIFDRIPVPSA